MQSGAKPPHSRNGLGVDARREGSTRGLRWVKGAQLMRAAERARRKAEATVKGGVGRGGWRWCSRLRRMQWRLAGEI
jgi:hypothetical protein